MRLLTFVLLLTPSLSLAETTYKTYDNTFIVQCDCNAKELRYELAQPLSTLGTGKYFWASKMNAQHNCTNAVTEAVNSQGYNFTLLEGEVYNCETIAEPNKREPVL